MWPSRLHPLQQGHAASEEVGACSFVNQATMGLHTSNIRPNRAVGPPSGNAIRSHVPREGVFIAASTAGETNVKIGTTAVQHTHDGFCHPRIAHQAGSVALLGSCVACPGGTYYGTTLVRNTDRCAGSCMLHRYIYCPEIDTKHKESKHHAP